MSYNNKENYNSKKDTHINLATVKKSILRNPEAPFRESSQKGSQNGKHKSETKCDNNAKSNPTPHNDTTLLCNEHLPQRTSSNRGIYLEPRLNTINEIRKNRDELKQCQAIYVDNTQELSGSTKKTISAKLNFPSRDQVFKNLTKLEEIPCASRKSYEQRVKKMGEPNAEIKDAMKQFQKHIDVDSQDCAEKPIFQPLPLEGVFLEFDAFSLSGYNGSLISPESPDSFFTSVKDEIYGERYAADFYESSENNFFS